MKPHQFSENASSSPGENAIPKFPNDREDFDDYRMVMIAFLDARGLWNSVQSTSKNETIQNNNKDESSSSPEVSVIDEKTKRAYAILLQSFGREQLRLVKSVPSGDAAMVWKTIEQNYGIIKTTETYVSLLDKLNNIKKLNKETIKTYVARIDKIIMDLECLGEKISLRHRKYYILEGLCQLDEWKLDVALIRKLDEDGNWDKEKLHQHLISEENRKLLMKSNNTDNDNNDAYTQAYITTTKHKINKNKTPCRFHVSGGCKKGNNCNFSHNTNNNKSEDECFNFKQYGSCKYGDNCKYTHSSSLAHATYAPNDYMF
jgi:hypothetical protein